MKTYSEFLSEDKAALAKIGSAWERKHPGMKFVPYDSDATGDIKLHSLEVPKEKRGQGIGSRALKGLSNYADKNQKRVTLTQAPDKGYKAKLDKFYKKNGFVANKGRNKDFTTRDTMIRNPKKLKEELITERPYQVFGPDPTSSSDSKSKPLGKPYQDKKRARKRADKLDQEIGGYRHSVKYVESRISELKKDLVEKRESAPDAEKTITKNWERKHKGMTARIKNKGDSYHIGDVWLPPASRNKGVGKRFVKGVTKFAGKQGKDVTLRASAESGQKDRLHNFYTKSGFQKQGKTDNYVKKPDAK